MKSIGKNIVNLIYLFGIILIVLFNLSPTTCYNDASKFLTSDDIDGKHNNINNNEYQFPNGLNEQQKSMIFNFRNSKKLPWKHKNEGRIHNNNNNNDDGENQESFKQLSSILQDYNNYEQIKRKNNQNDINKNYNIMPNDDVIINEDNIYNRVSDDEYNLNELNELDSSEIYGIENVKRDPFMTNNGHTNVNPEKKYQALCPIQKNKISLETSTHIYRPSHYYEIICFNDRIGSQISHSNNNKVCNRVEPGFECVQKNRTIYLTRRAKDDTCWETVSRTISGGCECMWPTHVHGDINAIH